MKLLGITGGVGMGKSTAGEWLRRRGVEVADPDVLARELAGPGEPALAQIMQRFGPTVLSASGELDRARLARLVFADAGARADLEGILHPRIRAAWQAAAAQWRAAGRPFGAVIIPLLFETGGESAFDAIVCMGCSKGSQWRRLRERGWSDSETRQRLEAQLPLQEKIARSDFLVWTDTTLEVVGAQLDAVLKELADDQ